MTKEGWPVLAKCRLVDGLDFVRPFWIARFGDYLYLFDHPSGLLLGRPLFSPTGKYLKEEGVGGV